MDIGSLKSRLPPEANLRIQIVAHLWHEHSDICSWTWGVLCLSYISLCSQLDSQWKPSNVNDDFPLSPACCQAHSGKQTKLEEAELWILSLWTFRNSVFARRAFCSVTYLFVPESRWVPYSAGCKTTDDAVLVTVETRLLRWKNLLALLYERTSNSGLSVPYRSLIPPNYLKNSNFKMSIFQRANV